MMATYSGSPMTPAQVAAQKTWFVMGLINWKALKISHLQFLRREYGRNDKNIQAAIKGDPNTFVLIQIKTRTIPSHWVWAIGINGSGYWVADPLYGDKVDLFKRYGHSITGAAYFLKV